MKTIKTELKAQANAIREMKQDISTGMRAGQYRGNSQATLIGLKETFRYNHLAYCMIRGREYKECENTTRRENEINMSKLEATIESMKAELLERNPQEDGQNA